MGFSSGKDKLTGLEIAPKTAKTQASDSTTACAVTQNLRAGALTIDMGHTWANGTVFTITLTNTTIDTDSVVLISQVSAHPVGWAVSTIADNSCKIAALNGSGSGIAADIKINYVVI